jgi:hypothetical protein
MVKIRWGKVPKMELNIAVGTKFWSVQKALHGTISNRQSCTCIAFWIMAPLMCRWASGNCQAGRYRCVSAPATMQHRRTGIRIAFHYTRGTSHYFTPIPSYFPVHNSIHRTVKFIPRGTAGAWPLVVVLWLTESCSLVYRGKLLLNKIHKRKNIQSNTTTFIINITTKGYNVSAVLSHHKAWSILTIKKHCSLLY